MNLWPLWREFVQIANTPINRDWRALALFVGTLMLATAIVLRVVRRRPL